MIWTEKGGGLLQKAGKIFGDFSIRTLIEIVEGHIRYLQIGYKWRDAISKIAEKFGQTPETISRVVNRLLPKFLLRVVDQRENFNTPEEGLARAYLVYLTKGYRHANALRFLAAKKRQSLVVIKRVLRNTLQGLILDLRPIYIEIL